MNPNLSHYTTEALIKELLSRDKKDLVDLLEAKIALIDGKEAVEVDLDELMPNHVEPLSG